MAQVQGGSGGCRLTDGVTHEAHIGSGSDALLVGNETELRKLRDAINSALANDSSSSGATTSDGEGYALLVICAPDEVIKTLELPYSSVDMRDEVDPTLTSPWSILPEARYKELVERVMAEEG